MTNEKEAYEWVRMLVAVVYAMSRRIQEQPELASSLRQSVLEAASHLLDSSGREDSEAHLTALNHSLLALNELATLLATGRESGDLPPEFTEKLLAVQGSATRAVDRAIEDWQRQDSDS